MTGRLRSLVLGAAAARAACLRIPLRHKVALLLLLPTLATSQQPAHNPEKAQSAKPEIFVQLGHSHPLAVAVSPDGRYIASGGMDGKVKLWEAQTGREIRTLHEHRSMVMVVRFTPDGAHVISGGANPDNSIALSSVAAVVAPAILRNIPAAVIALDISRDGELLVSAGERGTLRIWSLRSRQLLAAIDLSADMMFTAVAIHPDGEEFAVGSSVGHIEVRNLRSGERTRELTRQKESIGALAFSPSGALLAVGYGSMLRNEQPEIDLWEYRAEGKRRTLKGHTGSVRGLAFSPDGLHLVSLATTNAMEMMRNPVSADKQDTSIRIWDTKSGSVVSSQRHATTNLFMLASQAANSIPPVAAIAYAHDGRAVVFAGWDEAIRIVPVSGGQLASSARLLRGRGVQITHVRAAAGRRQLATAPLSIRGDPGAFQRVASMTRDEFLQEYPELTQLSAPERERALAAFDPASHTGVGRHRLITWNTRTGRQEDTAAAHRAPIAALTALSDGSISSLSTWGWIHQPHTLHMGLMREVIVASRDSRRVRHYAYRHGPLSGPQQILRQDHDEKNPLLIVEMLAPVEVSVSGERAVLAAYHAPPGNPFDQTHYLIVFESSPQGPRQQHLLRLPSKITAVALSRDGLHAWVAVDGANPTDLFGPKKPELLVIDLVAGNTIGRFQVPERTIDSQGIALSPDGRFAVTAGARAPMVWNIARGLLGVLVSDTQTGRTVHAVSFDPRGTKVASAAYDRRIRIWDWASRRVGIEIETEFVPNKLDFSSDGSRLFGAHDDGSVRVWNSADGRELARMFHFDDGEWMTITPEGFFVASQHGAKNLNVRMGNTLYSLNQFYDAFYRPDLVERKLEGEDISSLVTETLEEALRHPPPTATLVDLPAATPAEKVVVRFRVQSSGGGIGDIRVFHNGKIVLADSASSPTDALEPIRLADVNSGALTRALVVTASDRRTNLKRIMSTKPDVVEADVAIEPLPGENEVSIIAFNRTNSVQSEPVSARFNSTRASPEPRLYVLAVGIDDYAERPLKHAVRDALDFSVALGKAAQRTAAADHVVVRVLRNNEASREGILQALRRAANEVRPWDSFVFFVASHGVLLPTGYAIVGADFRRSTSSNGLISASELIDASKAIPALNQILVMDTCHAGGLTSSMLGLYDARMAILARNSGIHVFASAAETQEAMDGYRGNGLFTHSLLQSLADRGTDRNQDGSISVIELGASSRDRAIAIGRTINFRQTPVIMSFGQDRPLVASP